jgi:hypothetical protein
MVCAARYLNVAAAAVTGAGAGLTIAVGVGTTPAGVGVPVTIGGIIGALGSITWTISALMDLIACLRSKGKNEAADRLQEKVDWLERDQKRLREELEKLRGRAS